jgi:hypothetical protein
MAAMRKPKFWAQRRYLNKTQVTPGFAAGSALAKEGKFAW